jgi:membrane protein DedA with SNARE-associated domain
MKLLGFFKYAYLGFFVLFFIEFLRNYKTDFSKSIIFLILAILSVLLYWFRNKYQKRFKDRGKL